MLRELNICRYVTALVYSLIWKFLSYSNLVKLQQQACDKVALTFARWTRLYTSFTILHDGCKVVHNGCNLVHNLVLNKVVYKVEIFIWGCIILLVIVTAI